MVEVTRLELAASASRTQRSTKLSHTSININLTALISVPYYYIDFYKPCQDVFQNIFFFLQKFKHPLRDAFVFCFNHSSQPQPQSPSISQGRGGKKSSVGNFILRKTSQGLSDESLHCFSGTQKSYTGTSI